MAMGHIQKKMYREALQDAEKGLALSRRDPFFLSALPLFTAGWGRWNKRASFVEEMQAASQKELCGSVPLCNSFCGNEQEKEAMDALEEGYKAHDPYMVGLNSTPWFGRYSLTLTFKTWLRGCICRQ